MVSSLMVVAASELRGGVATSGPGVDFPYSGNLHFTRESKSVNPAGVRQVAKPKVALYWNASCGGCEEAWVDLNEDILKVADAVDIVLWPVALDFPYSGNLHFTRESKSVNQRGCDKWQSQR